MTQLNFSGIYRFLPGILLLQVLTVLLVIIALHSSSLVVFISFGFLSLMLGGISAFWFSIIAAQPQQDANATLPLKTRYKGRRRTTKKSDTKQDSSSDTTQDAPQSSKLSGIPLTGIMGLAGLGALVLLSQLITVGLLIFGTVGGIIAGYTWRVRQELRHQGGLVIIDPNSRMADGGWGQVHREPKPQEPPIDISP